MQLVQLFIVSFFVSSLISSSHPFFGFPNDLVNIGFCLYNFLTTLSSDIRYKQPNQVILCAFIQIMFLCLTNLSNSSFGLVIHVTSLTFQDQISLLTLSFQTSQAKPNQSTCFHCSQTLALILTCVIPVELPNNKNKLLVHMYVVKNTTTFLILCLLYLRYCSYSKCNIRNIVMFLTTNNFFLLLALMLRIYSETQLNPYNIPY